MDDEYDTIYVYTRLLKRFGFEIDAARTLHDAQHVMRSAHYHIIITDLRLSGCVGEEGLEILRTARQSRSDAEVIVVTGYGSPAAMTQAYQLGAAYYFEKPVKPVQLLNAMEQLCRC